LKDVSSSAEGVEGWASKSPEEGKDLTERELEMEAKFVESKKQLVAEAYANLKK